MGIRSLAGRAGETGRPIARQPRLGLALSGGTARAVAHVGVIRALEEAGLRFDCIAGTSGGAVVAVLLAAGFKSDDIERQAAGLKWKDLTNVTLARLGFLSSQRIGQFIEEAIGDITFSQLALPCAVVATNLGTGARRIFASGRVSEAVRASCSIPQIFSPCEVDGELYVDGGFVEYMPVRALEIFDPEVIVGVNLGAKREYTRRPKHILQLIMQITSVVSRQNMAGSERRASFVIRPDLSAFNPFVLEEAPEMVRIGYEETRRHLPSLLGMIRHEASPWRRFARRWSMRL